MPVFWNYKENNIVYAFDDVFVPADAFRQGTLWIWGKNNFGQLGINDTNMRCTPVQTSTGGTDWKQVSCGGYTTAAIKTDGTLWVWGRNEYGQLGTNDKTRKCTPVTTFAGGTNWKQVSCPARGENTAAIKTDGTLWIWGSNQNGQLGINSAGSVTHRCTPVQEFNGATNWKQVSAGYNYTAAIQSTDIL